MQPALEYLPRKADESFVTRFFDYPYFPTPWHFHPEYELVLVTESTGKRYVGNQLSAFEPGDLVLLGPYLPHTYQNDKNYLEGNSNLRAKSIVVHFREDTFGDGFFNLPESLGLKNLLSRSASGLSIIGKTNLSVRSKLFDLIGKVSLTKWLILVDILNELSDSADLIPICDSALTGHNSIETKRMNIVIDFVVANMSQEIRLEQVAQLAGMAPTSFSRYFTQRTRKSFTAFVNEVRLSQASVQLRDTLTPVGQIYLDCGFNNLSNFNRQFKKRYKYSPLAFRKQYQEQLYK